MLLVIGDIKITIGVVLINKNVIKINKYKKKKKKKKKN
jgi:hypothetical protein